MNPKIKALGLEIADDRRTRHLYATDGSIYEIMPQAVGFPKSAHEAATMIQHAAEDGLSIIPRGAGTGLVGGALGDGLVIDFARHNHQIHAFDRERQRVKVGPGVVLDQLNRFLKPHGFTFGPDVATSSRATIGGMIGNNSSGARVRRYGTTTDHLHRLEVVTVDGKITQIDQTSPAFPTQSDTLQQIVLDNHSSLTTWRQSPVNKRWPGYALHRWNPGTEGWPAIFCGSEGTLAGFTSAELQVVPLPKRRGLGLVHFQNIGEAMQASVAILELDPTAIEHIDRILLDQTRGQLAFQKAREFLDIDQRPSESILIVEFDQDDMDDRLRQLARLGLGSRIQFATESAHQNLVWALRKAGLSLLTGCKGSAKPTTGIEDAALPPDKLPNYVEALQNLLRTLKLDACFYGHAAAGLLHVRPVLNIHAPEDQKRFRHLAQEVSALVKEFKGSLAAEHGVGMARSEFMSDQIDAPLLEGMRALKRAFDPNNRMNPGKIFGSPEFAIEKNIRTTLENDTVLPFQPRLRYAAKDESFTAHLNQCNGCGGCRKQSATMCPTFIATGDESMSTRGRANLIRATLSHPESLESPPLISPELDHALSHCLGCKACATECPSNVNLSLLKSELLHARYQQSSLPWQARLISEADWLGRLGTRFPMLGNAFLKDRTIRRLLETYGGFSAKRPLPFYAAQRFDTWFQRRPTSTNDQKPNVLLWDDTFTRYHEPHIGIAAVSVLERAGYKVHLVSQRSCCGRPAFSQGNLRRAAGLGSRNLNLLTQYPTHWPILFVEPSCYSMFVEDYTELGLEGAQAIASRCHLVENYIFRDENKDRISKLPRSPNPIAIHLHCHSKAIIPIRDSINYATTLFPQNTLLDSGCCGMAGAFGALESKYDLSVNIAAPLIKKIGTLPHKTPIAASGTSCRQQISHLASHPVFHPIEVIFHQFEPPASSKPPQTQTYRKIAENTQNPTSPQGS